jgi:hypothetical protein
LVIKQLKSEYDALSPEAKKAYRPDGMSKKHRLADDVVPAQENKKRRSQNNKDMKRVMSLVTSRVECLSGSWKGQIKKMI